MAVKTELDTLLANRESEIGRLVAGGLTNREIAARLVLSVRTVECHLWSAYRKTGTGTRTRLALWLICQGEASHSLKREKRARDYPWPVSLHGRLSRRHADPYLYLLDSPLVPVRR